MRTAVGGEAGMDRPPRCDLLLLCGWALGSTRIGHRVGPTLGSHSHQQMAGQGYDLRAFVIDCEPQQACCSQGQTSVKWTPGRDIPDNLVVRIRFDRATCRACPARQACTWAKDAPCQLAVRPKAQHKAIQAARQRQEPAEFTAQYARRAGGEGTHVRPIRQCGLRQPRYMGWPGFIGSICSRPFRPMWSG
jgi:transposase